MDKRYFRAVELSKIMAEASYDVQFDCAKELIGILMSMSKPKYIMNDLAKVKEAVADITEYYRTEWYDKGNDTEVTAEVDALLKDIADMEGDENPNWHEHMAKLADEAEQSIA